jgi:hypothetical protein
MTGINEKIYIFFGKFSKIITFLKNIFLFDRLSFFLFLNRLDLDLDLDLTFGPIHRTENPGNDPQLQTTHSLCDMF